MELVNGCVYPPRLRLERPDPLLDSCTKLEAADDAGGLADENGVGFPVRTYPDLPRLRCTVYTRLSDQTLHAHTPPRVPLLYASPIPASTPWRRRLLLVSATP
jgi:hypothetical protein